MVGGHGAYPSGSRCAGGGGWPGCRGGVLRADAKLWVGSEAEFDLFAPKIGNGDLLVPNGRYLRLTRIRSISKSLSRPL